MPRQDTVAVDNSFKNGLVTQATGLNFPDNACTETYNCEFNIEGSVSRRLGFAPEVNAVQHVENRHNRVTNTYLWRNVNGDGNVSIVVAQVGDKIYLYRIISGDAFSSLTPEDFTLTPVSGAPNPESVEAQYSDGNGLLFVTHPYCDPVRVSYNVDTDVATVTSITIKIRDFEGAIADSLAVDDRPTSTLAALNDNHEYNLRNQGWTTTGLTAWDTAQTTMPSNADIMWRFKDATNDLDFSSASIDRITAGNTPAPKGHYILTLSNQDRDAIAGTTGVAATTTGHQRPSTSAFFAGRVFYSNVNYVGFNSKIYFTQIIERPEQYGFCYQTNDPTSEDLFDLLPSDGGVISIPDAGTIYKLIAMTGGLGVFAANGVWFISGSSAIGFAANDYTIQRIALIPTISATSFVNVQGYPAWWNSEGIYMIAPAQGGATFGMGSQLPDIKSLTFATIKTFFDDIPLNSKRYARGAYDRLNGRIKWIYRSEGTMQLTEQYEYDRVLNYNVNTGAFYPWTISENDRKINSILISDTLVGDITVNNVTANAGVDNVVDGSSNQVISFAFAGISTLPVFKYWSSEETSSTAHDFTFYEILDTDYLDFGDTNYNSYFITGYKIKGDAIKKFQSNWVKVFSKTITPVAYKFQGIWDYAITGNTGRWSSADAMSQSVSHNDTNFAYGTKRLKVRGHGVVLQFRVASLEGEPFEIAGWSTYHTANALP